MTETQPPSFGTLVPYDRTSQAHVSSLIDLFRGYLLEELDRTGEHAPGIPVADWLNTFLVLVDDTAVGFCSADTTRYAIELIYITPSQRGRGLASLVLQDLRASCPGTMRLKAPVTPGGAALAARLGIGLSAPVENEIRHGREAMEALHQTINRRCPHKRAGNPQRPCRRCYRAVIKRTAGMVIVSYSRAARAA